MVDIDKVLDGGRGDIARAAAAAAQLPEFEALARRGRGRRTRRQVGALAAAALAVAGIVGAVQLFGSDGDARPAPPVDRTTEPTEPTDDATASDGPSQAELAAVVDSKDASMFSMAAAPGDPERMATLWQWSDPQWVLAWTSDGFATRTLLAVPSGSTVTPAAGGAFVLREGWEGAVLRIIDDGGVGEPIRVSGADAPVGADEVPVVLVRETGGTALVAVAADGTAHPVAVPTGLDVLTSFGNRLVGYSYGNGLTYYWSDDGGATWQDADPGPGEFPPLVVEAAIGQDHAIIEGGDGATLFPFVAVRTASASTPGQWTRVKSDTGADNATIGGAWNEDGEIRVLASLWNQEGRLVDAGVWRVVGGRLEKVTSDHPEISDQSDISALGLEYVDGPVVWVQGPKRGEIWRSTDGGATWESFAAR